MVKQYVFPTLKDSTSVIAQKRNELMDRYRRKDKIAPEELDWLDWADRSLDEEKRA